MKKSSVKKNYIYNVSYSILNMLLPLITAPYLARILSTDGVGIYAYSFSIAQFFVLIAKLGLTNYGTREISKIEDKKKKEQIFSNLFYMQILSTIFISIIYILYIVLFAGSNMTISMIFLIWIFLSFLDIDWFWYGEEEFKKISIRNIIIKLISVVLVFIFVKEKSDLILYTIIIVSSFVLGYAALWFGISKKIKFQKFDIKLIRKHFLPCLIMLLPVLALNIYRSMDKVMLGAIVGMDATGIYENGEKLIYCLSSLISAYGTVMLPRLSYLFEIKDKEKIEDYMSTSLKFIVILTSIMSFGLMSISDSVIPLLFGEKFVDSSMILSLCSPTLLFMGWSNVIRTQYIIPNKNDNIYVKSVLYGSIINVIINALLIPKYQAIGAVIGTIIAELFVPIYQYIKLRKQLNYKKYVTSVIFYPVLGVLMLIVLKIVQGYLGIGVVTMCLQIVIGALIYLFGMIIYIYKFDKNLMEKILTNVRGG